MTIDERATVIGYRVRMAGLQDELQAMKEDTALDFIGDTRRAVVKDRLEQIRQKLQLNIKMVARELDEDFLHKTR